MCNVYLVKKTETGDQISSDFFTAVVEQNQGTVTTPTPITFNSAQYYFTAWSDGTTANPITVTPTQHTYLNAIYQSSQVSGTLAQSITWNIAKTLTGNVYVPSGVTLTIAPSVTVNFNGNSITSNGGTITIQSGNMMACAKLRNGGTINGLFGTVQSAVNASSSGQTVEISSGTFNEDVTINGISNLTLTGNSSNNTTITGTITAYSCPGLYVSSLCCFRMFFNNCNNSTFYGFEVASTSGEVAISHYYCSNFQSSGAVYNSDCGLLAYTSDGYIYSNGNFDYNNIGVSAQASSNITALGSMFCSNVSDDLAALYYSHIDAYNCYYSNYTPKIREYAGGTVYINGINSCGFSKRSNQTTTQENLPSANQIQSDDSLAVEFSNINLSYFSVIKNINDAAKENSLSNQSKLYDDHKAVINSFKTFTINNPNSSLAKVAFATAAHSYWQYKEFDEMKNYLNETISNEKLYALKSSAERFMIEYYREINDFKSAINSADTFIKKYGNDKESVCDALFGKGLILSHDLNQPEKAAECFSAIVKAYPDNKIAVLAKNELSILGKGIKEIQKENKVAELIMLNIGNYPNPFNPSTEIKYGLTSTSDVRLVVFDVLGREVAELVHGVKEAGNYTATFNGNGGLASGIYFARITVTPQDGSKPLIQTLKMMLAK